VAREHLGRRVTEQSGRIPDDFSDVYFKLERMASQRTMSILRESAKKIWNGLLFGIGFGIAVGFIYYFISEKINEKMMKSVWNDTAIDKLVVTSPEEVPYQQGSFILGMVENRGGESVRMARVEIDLFDKAGKFVDQCSERYVLSLRPNEARNFKVTCGTNEKPVAEHASFKVRVVGM
jgi:hypothetical protein